jgi:hypothetical protein
MFPDIYDAMCEFDCKGKGHPITGHQGPRGGGWSAPRPGRFTPRAGLDVCEKSHPPPGFDPRAVQPVVSRDSD